MFSRGTLGKYNPSEMLFGPLFQQFRGKALLAPLSPVSAPSHPIAGQLQPRRPLKILVI